MHDIMNYTVTIIAVLLIFFLIMKSRRESFDTIQEKRDANKDYFSDNSKPTYEDYRSKVPGANFVDYNKYKKEFLY